MYFKVEKNCFQALKTFYPSHQALNESGVSDNFSNKMFFHFRKKHEFCVYLHLSSFFVGFNHFDQQAYHLKPETNCLLFYSHPVSLFLSLFFLLSSSPSLFLSFYIIGSVFLLSKLWNLKAIIALTWRIFLFHLTRMAKQKNFERKATF